MSDLRFRRHVAPADAEGWLADVTPPVLAQARTSDLAAGSVARRTVRAPRGALWIADVATVGAAAVLAVLLGAPVAAVACYAAVVALAVASRRVPISPLLSSQLPRLIGATALPALVLLPWLPASDVWWLALGTFGALVVGRGCMYAILGSLRRRGLLVERAVIVGAGETGQLVARLLAEHPELGLEPVGFVDGCPRLDEAPLPSLGGAADLVATVSSHGVARVLVCFPVEPDRDLVTVLRQLRSQRVDVCVVPRLQELGAQVPRSALDEIWGVPVIPMSGGVPSARGRLAKRSFDVVVSSLLLCALAPLLALAALLVRLRIGSPVLFRQRRVTGEGRTASILKLHTLPAHGASDTTWAVPTSGVSRLGRWLRATHVDELPQLVNVLRGDMSLVGPRPERPYFVDRFRAEVPEYADRMRMPAGLTGWAQVHGLHGDTSIRDRVRMDNQYIESWTPWLDVVILLRTVGAALRRPVRSVR